MNADCLFCRLYRDGDHVASTEGFVAIRDLNPQADTHLLVLPERHVESFHDIGVFPPDEAINVWIRFQTRSSVCNSPSAEYSSHWVRFSPACRTAFRFS